ncbi:MAG: maleate isomerase [Parasphingorhabdus sp.]|jgi:maleate isomerase
MKMLEFDVLPENYVRRLGLIVLQSDVTIEDEFRYFFEGIPVSLMVNRIPFENEVTIETLKQMEGHLTTSMSLFPLDAEFDSMGYGCTSGSLHIGDESIAKLVKESRPCESVSNPMLAAITAMRHIGAKNIAYLAPYSEEVSQTMIDEFERHDIHVEVAATFNEKYDKIVGRISPDSIRQASIELVKGQNVDAVFVACTNMKCAHIIPFIEQETGIVATSSNQVLAWHMAQLSGLAGLITNKGRLFES